MKFLIPKAKQLPPPRVGIKGKVRGKVTKVQIASFVKILRDHADFSRSAFGDEDTVGPIGPVKHLIKEAGEILEAPEDTVEYVDALFLTADAIRRHLHQTNQTFEDFIYIASVKLEELKARDWSEPKDGEAREHIR